MTQSFVMQGYTPPSINLMKKWRDWYDLKETGIEFLIICSRLAKIKPVDRCTVKIICYLDNVRSDESNIKAGAEKVLLDGLVREKIIKDDRKKWLEHSEVVIEYVKTEPYTEIIITELKEQGK